MVSTTRRGRFGGLAWLVVTAFLVADTPSFANTAVAGKPFSVNGPSGLVAAVSQTSVLDAKIAAGQNAYPKLGLTKEQALFNYYTALLSSPAVSGLQVGAHWDVLVPTQGATPDWSYIDEAFDAVSAWNLANSTQKFVQVGISGGFYTPQWVYSLMAGGSCDGLFMVPQGSAKASCGYTNIFLETESGTPTPMTFPMPWNTEYQSLWKAFLTDLNSHIQNGYYQSPDGQWVPYLNSFASIAVGGPTASSTEMILPHDGSDTLSLPYCNHLTPLPDCTTASGINDLVAWDALLTNHYGVGSSYVDSDQAFVDAWETEIDTYGQIFSGTTLVLSTGAGLPVFPAGVPSTLPVGIGAADCGPTFTMDCAAEATIVAYFAQQSVGGFNAKLVAQLGQRANLATPFPLSGLSIEWLDENTSGGLTELTGSTTVLSQMYGGLQFAGGVSGSDSKIGCVNVKTGPCPVSPEQGLYNVLQLIFRGTSAAPDYGESSSNTAPSFSDAPLNYVQIYDTDIFYGLGMLGCPGGGDITAGTCVAQITTSTTNFQSELVTANQEMLSIAEPAVVYMPDPLPPGNPGTCPTPGPSCHN